MKDIIRDAPAGQLIRLLTRNRFFKYPEEEEGFKCPCSYKEGDDSEVSDKDTSGKPENKKKEEDSATDGPDDEDEMEAAQRLQSRRFTTLQRTLSLPYTAERLKIEQAIAAERAHQIPIEPTKTADGVILADWYNSNDPENPQNWSQAKKSFVALQIDLYTFTVYCGSSIYVSSELGVIARFGATQTEASLGLALYVLGYGLGPLIWAPMSEIPSFGRNFPYIVTFGVYMILSVPTALAPNLAGLLVCRFLQGFFGSPCLANGGASMQDMYSLLYLPYSIAIWISSMFAAPALGPILSGFAVTAENWRWSLWEIIWLASPVFILWMLFLPETSANTILLHRAKRLRKISGNEKIRSQGEIERKDLTPSAVFIDAIIKPFEIMIKDPAVLFTNVYTALTYGIYYSFFEVFPLVYGPLYHFNLGETGLVFICIVLGCFLGLGIYFTYLTWFLIPDILKNGLQVQEFRLRPALSAVFIFTLTLFAFGWTANTHIHWIVTCVCLTIYSASIFIILQCIFVYVPMSYPQYAASLFAGNDFCRSAFAFAAVLFSEPMYERIGIGQGISLLAGLSVIGIFGVWLLYFYGAKLRAQSSFAI